MNVRPAGREACNCASPYNSILERLDAMEAEILTAMQEANTAVGIANAALRQVQAAGIRTVNQIQPDADGEFSITAGSGIQINADTNGIEIENISEGVVYTGVSPIEVNADNEISLKDWTEDITYKWAKYIDSNYDLTEDIVLKYNYSGTDFTTVYIPKGCRANRICIPTKGSGNNTPIRLHYIPLSSLLADHNNGSVSISASSQYITISTSGSSINQIVSITNGNGAITVHPSNFNLYHR